MLDVTLHSKALQYPKDRLCHAVSLTADPVRHLLTGSDFVVVSKGSNKKVMMARVMGSFMRSHVWLHMGP